MPDVREQLQISLGSAFTLDRELGGGAMSRVFIARDERLGRTIVVKVLAPELAEGISAERFAREIRLAAQLQAPHIVPLLAAGTTAGGLPYYCMPFVRGASLRQRMGQGIVPVTEAVDILRDIAKALAYAHDQGVVHRDIKPDNVLLHEGSAVVMDFGIAKALQASAPAGAARTLTLIGTSLGTPAYMSPEQALGEAADARTDVYAWGVVAYELLAGSHPFAGKSSAQQLVAAHVMEQPPPLAERATTVPTSLASLVHQCMAKNADERPASGAEILRALADCAVHPGTTFVGPAIPTPELPSIAVLPLTNIGAELEDRYFAEGVTEEILNALAHVGNLRVAARTSAFALSASNLDVRTIGQRLGVRSVLEGSVRRSGRRIRVTAQLVDAAEGLTLWSERYDREVTDVFAIQEEIADAVVGALRVRLAREPGAPLVRRPTDDFAAYELYLRGRHYWNLRGDGLWKSLLYFEQALIQDPAYAAAYSGVADAAMLLELYAMVESSVTRPRALTAARRAVELDPMLADAHASLGHILSFDVPGSGEGERELIRALELNAAHSAARYWLAIARHVQGRHAEAVATAREAAELDPLSSATQAIFGWMLVDARLESEALGVLEKALSLNPDSFIARYFLARAYTALGRTEDAFSEFERALKLSRRGSWALAGFGHALAATGRRDEAQQVRLELETRSSHDYVSSAHLARLNASVGDFDRAFDLLERAFERREMQARFEIFDPAWDPVRAHTRFIAIMERIGVPPDTYHA